MIIGTCSVYYFTIALMNHNTENTLDYKNREKSRDFGEN